MVRHWVLRIRVIGEVGGIGLITCVWCGIGQGSDGNGVNLTLSNDIKRHRMRVRVRDDCE